MCWSSVEDPRVTKNTLCGQLVLKELIVLHCTSAGEQQSEELCLLQCAEIPGTLSRRDLGISRVFRGSEEMIMGWTESWPRTKMSEGVFLAESRVGNDRAQAPELI